MREILSGLDWNGLVVSTHGSGGDETEWANQGRAAQTMDNLMARCKAEAMIVSVPNGHINRTAALGAFASSVPASFFEYAIHFGQPLPMQGTFEESLPKNLIPYVEKRFHANPNKDDRASPDCRWAPKMFLKSTETHDLSG